MASDLEEKVLLCGSCYYNMLRSVIEPLSIVSKESGGDLIGRKNRNSFILINAYPLLTYKRKPKSVEYKNNTAIERLRRLDRAVNKLGGLGTRILGEYHSHVYKRDEERQRGLSKADVDFISDEIKKLGVKYWIELVLTIKTKEYRRTEEVGEFFIPYKNKLRVILRDTPNHGYDIVMGVYKVEKEPRLRVKELKVKMRKVKVTPI